RHIVGAGRDQVAAGQRPTDESKRDASARFPIDGIPVCPTNAAFGGAALADRHHGAATQPTRKPRRRANSAGGRPLGKQCWCSSTGQNEGMPTTPWLRARPAPFRPGGDRAYRLAAMRLSVRAATERTV